MPTPSNTNVALIVGAGDAIGGQRTHSGFWKTCPRLVS